MASEVFLLFFVNTAYIFCLSPFRFTFVRAENGRSFYSVKTWVPQKILCAIQAILGLSCILQAFIAATPHDTKNPTKHFRFMALILDTLLKIHTLKELWLNQSDLANIVNSLASRENKFPRNKVRLTHPLIAGMIVFLYTALGISNWVSGSGLFTDTKGQIVYWSFEKWWTCMVDSGRKYFFLPKSAGNTTKNVYSGYYNGIDIFIGVVGSWANFHR